jgi:outer membrane protein assembly factor BamB
MMRVLFALLAFTAPAAAEEWPGWRGPRGDGTSLETGVPLQWSPNENIRWKIAIPGKGHSSPIVWGDRVFVTTCLESSGERLLVCLDSRNGAERWRRTVLRTGLEQKHRLNSFASSTPVTDGRHVWVTFLDRPNMVVVCYDVDGNEVWRRSPGTLTSVHGFCTSPVLYKELLILNGDQDGPAYIVALDKSTGREVWRADRPNRTRSYCTPILIESPSRPGVTQLVLSGSKCVAAYDADTGKLLWLHDGPTEQYVASLVYSDDMLFLTTGFPEFHLMGIRPDGSGNITGTPHVAWHIPHTENKNGRYASYVPSPLAYQGHFFVISDLGWLGCIEAKTGRRLWNERLGRHFSASPVLVEGHLLIPDDDGITRVVKASPKFELIRSNPLGDECYASPAVAHGCLFVRTAHDLWCIGDGSPRGRVGRQPAQDRAADGRAGD